MKAFLKVILVGILTTLSRALGQMLIPDGTQSVLQPALFVKNGTLPIAFMIYGIFAYSIIAALYLLIENKLSGHRIIKGLKYGLSCCAVWVVYLLEPLPHISPIDKITYPLADGMALIVMGLLLGLLLSKSKPKEAKETQSLSKSWLDVLCIAACFINGRIAQYFILNIYSSFNTAATPTILWTLLTGVVIAAVVLWPGQYLNEQNKVIKALLSGGVLFGANLLLFNFFMPLVFNTDIPDLILRTAIDIGAVTVGLLLLPLPVSSKRRKEIRWIIK